MKRSLSLVLAVLMLIPALLTACDNGDTPAQSTACTHAAMSDWSFTGERTCQGQGFHTRTCADCGYSERELLDMAEAEPEYKSLDKKTVMFLGNSFIYYGYCVMDGSQGSPDRGYFYHICKQNGETTTVYDYVWGGITLKELYEEKLQTTSAKQKIARTDVVFMSEAGQNNASIVADIQNIMGLFPEKTEFFYLNHAHTVSQGHSNITNSFDLLRKMGVGIVNWGELAYDVWTGKTAVPGGSLTYNKNSFVVNKLDSHHQNMLSGYITAQMAYCAYTKRSALSQDYTVSTNTKLSGAFDPAKYMSNYYKTGTTNIDRIMSSEAEMRGILTLMDQYLDKYGIKVGKQLLLGEHDYVAEGAPLSTGGKDCKALVLQKCRYCDAKVVSEVEPADTSRVNEMLITAADLEAAGAKSVFEYIKNGNSTVIPVAKSGWGRAGLVALKGAESVCDGSRACRNSTAGDVFYLKISDLKAKYDENGKAGAGGKYCALVGYDFTERKSVDSCTIYFDDLTSPTAFDILGGKKNADGTITWQVLASCTDMKDKYCVYDPLTVVCGVSFDAAEIDCFQIGIVSAPDRSIYISEIELFG